jgi:hypothetical protein
VVSERRLGDAQIEGSAASRLRALGQALHDPQPLRIAEGVQHVGDLQLVAGGVEQGHQIDCTPIVVLYGTIFVVLTN